MQPPQDQPYYRPQGTHTQPPYYQQPYQPQGTYTQPPPPRPPEKNWSRVIMICGVCILLLIAGSRIAAAVIAYNPKAVATTSLPTVAPKPTQVPTHAVAPTPVPTSPPAPTQVVVPTQPPVLGVNGNPWGYDFTPGDLIYNPPPDFCTQYFACVTTFWRDTNGYVAQCANGVFTHSGGVRGACSRDDGEVRSSIAISRA
jgi:hypothetical protein